MADEIVASEDRNWWKWRRDELTGAVCIINPAGTEYEISAPRLAQFDRDVATLLNDMLEGLIDLQNENEALRTRDALRDLALASPQLYLDKMSKRCLELELVLEQVKDALLGVDCLLSDEEPLLQQNIRDLGIERNAKALKILRDWHRSQDRDAPVPLSPPSAEQ